MYNTNMNYITPEIDLSQINEIDILSTSNDGEWDIN